MTSEKITYLIEINKLVGATRISDCDAEKIKSIINSGNYNNDLTPWTVSTDAQILSFDIKTKIFPSGDRDFFCFIGY